MGRTPCYHFSASERPFPPGGERLPPSLSRCVLVPAALIGMVIAHNRQPTSGQWRWLSLASCGFALLGTVLLAASSLSPPATVRETVVSLEWHTATHPAGTIIVSGLALHPGPNVAALAASLTPAAAPASILTLALPPPATETSGVAASPGAGASARIP